MDHWTWLTRSGVILYPDLVVTIPNMPYRTPVKSRQRRKYTPYQRYKSARRLNMDYASRQVLQTIPRPTMASLSALGASVNTGVMPRMTRQTLVYATSDFINPAIGTIANKYWTANDIYDPQTAIGGHKPRGYDTLAQFYSHYKVVKAVCIFTFTPVKQQYFSDTGGVTGAGTTEINGCAVNINCGLDNDASGPPTISGDPCSVNEVNGSKYRIISAAEAGAKRIVLTYTPRGFFGPAATNVSTGADFGSSPSAKAYFRISACGVHPSATPANVFVQATIKYYVECSQHKDQAAT